MSLKKRSVSLYGHQTSLALEEEFWAIIDAHLIKTEQSFARFIRELDDKRLEDGPDQNLASYLRVWVLNSVLSEQ